MDIMQSGIVEVKLTRGLVTIIDADDLELVTQHKWCAARGRKTDYVQRSDYTHGRKQTIWLHRVLLNATEGMHVDHIDSDGLNNTRANLRVCTVVENMRNSLKRKGKCSSKYKGVIKHKDGRPKPWMAQIRVGKKTYTRCLKTELEAAITYDEMAREHFGEFAKLNFP